MQIKRTAVIDWLPKCVLFGYIAIQSHGGFIDSLCSGKAKIYFYSTFCND